MAMRLALLGGKGGTGKSTIAINLADLLSLDGRTLLIDADPQPSAAGWLGIRDTPASFDVVELPRATIDTEIDGLAKGYEHVVIDGPPRAADILRSALLAASYVVLPIQPSGLDLAGQLPVLALRTEARRFLPKGQRMAFAISRRIAGTAIGKGFAGQLEAYGLPVLEGTHQRVVYAESVSEGQTVREREPNGPAVRELADLLTHIRRL